MSDIVSLTKDGFQLLEFLRGVAEADIISGFYKWDGTLIHGEDKIPLQVAYEGQDGKVWWYYTNSLEDYTFIHFPVIPSVHELIGRRESDAVADAGIWRWVAPSKPGVIVGGNSAFNNVKVDFIVAGYRPKALVKYFSRKQ